MASTFDDVQKILFDLADAHDFNTRLGIYGRHDAQGRYSWENEKELLASIANPRGTDIRLIPNVNFAPLTDAQITAQCPLLQMLSPSPPAPARMPPLSADAPKRRKAEPAELQIIIAWLRSLNYPRS